MIAIRRCIAVGLPLFALLGAARGGETGGRAVLTEASVWRTHVTWGPIMQQGSGGTKPAKAFKQLGFSTEPPSQDWTKPEFEDGTWGLWRETHRAETLQGTSEPLYDTWQYGAQQSACMRRRCLRGSFEVADPGGVRGLKLNVVYRGGVVVYLNGQEVGRGHLPKEAAGDALGMAEVYPKEVYTDLAGKPWELKNGSIGTLVFKDEPSLKRFNLRMRKLSVDVPSSALRKGTNVLALDLRAAPAPDDVPTQDWWSACGAASIELRGDGAVTGAERPAGVQVWSASPLFRASPFGNTIQGRVGNGRSVLLWSFPLCWVGAGEAGASIRMVGTRNGTFAGQVVVSSAGAIRGLKAVASDLVQKGGGGKIGAAECSVGYLTFPAQPPSLLTDPAVSLLDALQDEPPGEFPALPAKAYPGMPDLSQRAGGVSWCEGGATVPVWLRVRVPKEAPEGEYTGTLTVSADGLAPTAVPVSLKVHGYVLPDSRDFTACTAMVHSPDSLALQYNVPLWSDRHFELMDKTCERMGELGGSVAFIPLITNTWLGNGQTMVRWGGGGPDFTVLDRYLDMVQKHMKPRVVCLYVYDAMAKGGVSVSNASGGSMPAPAYGATPEAIAFWKPAIGGVLERLKKRQLDKCVTLGLVFESGGRGRDNIQPVVDLFQAAWPEGKWTDLAHVGAKSGNLGGVPYGFAMSVWGNETPHKSKLWGVSDIPIVVVKHYRADPIIDLRAIASRGSLYWAAEDAMSPTHWTRRRGGPSCGIGPLGMDFWNFAGKGGKPGPLEGAITNLNMHTFSCAALLAPGPKGPLPTARFEIFRQGLQACEARALIERAIEGGKLSGDLAKRCGEVLRRRDEVFEALEMSETNAQGDGWRWLEGSNWTDLAGELFSTASEVARATGK